MRYYAAALAAVLALAVPALAAESGKDTSKVKCKTIVLSAGDDENLAALGEGGCGKAITITEDGENKVINLIGEDGENKVINLKADQLLGQYDKLDADTRLKLLDAKIANLKATSQLKTDLAVKRLEVEKLELAKKPDTEIVAKKKELNALKAQLADARLDYEQTVKKLVPKDVYESYMLGAGDDTDLLEMNLGLPTGSCKQIIKRIVLRSDGEDDD